MAAPIFSKAPLAFRTVEDSDNTVSDVGSTLKGALSLAPLAVGVGVGLHRVKANSPVPLSGSNINDLGATAADVGERIERLHALTAAQREKDAEKAMRGLMDAGGIERTLREANDERKALLSALLPEFEGNPVKQQQLLDAISKTEAIAETEIQDLKNSIKTVLDTGGSEAASRIERARSLYGTVANQLRTPLPQTLPGIEPVFNPLHAPDGNFGKLGIPKAGLISHQWKRLTGMLGTTSPDDVRLVSFMEEGIGESYYAEVMRNRRVAMRVPLNAARIQVRSTRGGKPLGAPVYRIGESGVTTSIGAQLYMDVPAVKAMTASGKVPTGAAIIGSLRRSAAGGVGREPFMRLEEAIMMLLQDQIKRKGPLNQWGRGDFNYFNQLMRDLGTQLERGARPNALQGVDPAMNIHMKNQAFLQTTTGIALNMEGITQAEQEALIPSLSATKGSAIGIGTSSEIKRYETVGQPTRVMTQFGIIGDMGVGTPALEGNAPINLLRNIGGINQENVPATARLRQMIGRPERFVASNVGGFNPVGSTLGKGGAIQMWGQNLEFASDMVSTLNSAVLMNVKGGGAPLGLGEGMAYWGMRPYVQNVMSKTILDPADIRRPQSPLLAELIEKFDKRAGPLVVGGRGADYSIDDFFSKFGAKSRSGGAWIGSLDTGLEEIPKYSDLSRMTLHVEEASMAGGRRRFHLVRNIIRGGMPDKVFSTLAKSGIHSKQLTDEMLSELVNKRIDPSGRLASAMSSMGLKAGHTMVNAGDMLSKGSNFLANQMLSIVGLISKGQDRFMQRRGRFVGGMAGLYERSRVAMGPGADQLRPTEFLTRMTKFVASRIGALEGVTAQEAGVAFGGIYTLAGTKKRPGKFGLVRADVTRAIMSGFRGKGKGQDFINEVLRTASIGATVGVAGVFPSTPASTYRATLGSMEPRYFHFLQHRLQNVLGFTREQTADVLTSVLARKEGIGAQLTSIVGLTRSVESMGNMQGFLSEGFTKGLKTLDVNTYIQGMGGDEAKARKFLSGFKEGFLLDLGTGLEPTAGLAKAHFEGNNLPYMPGGNTLDQMRGVELLRREQNLLIENEYIRSAVDFSRNLETLQQVSLREGDKLAQVQARAGEFREATARAFSGVMKATLSGKILGSGLFLGRGINLAKGSETLGYSSGQLERMRTVLKQTKGDAVFMSGQAFLDTMRTYTKAAENENLLKGDVSRKLAQRQAREEARDIFKAFFLGMEKRLARPGEVRFGGVQTFLGRDPMLGFGHLVPGRGFRSDFGAGEADDIFKKFTGTKLGGEALDKLQKAAGRPLESFRAIAELGGQGDIPKARNQFFSAMANNIALYTGEGKGEILFPDIIANVHYTKKTGKPGVDQINFSKALMMGGDFDDDRYKLSIHSDKKGLMSTDVAQKLATNYEDLVYAAHTQKYFAEAKKGLENLKISGTTKLGHYRTVFESGMKEVFAEKIGALNVALDQIRLGMLNTVQTKEDMRAAQRGISMLFAVQEVANIKAKKLEEAIPLVTMLTRAARRAIDTGGGDTHALEQIINQIYSGTEVLSPQKTITNVEVPGLFEGGKAFENIRRAIEGAESEGMEDVYTFMRRGLSVTKSMGLDRLGTERRAQDLAMLKGEQGHRYWTIAMQNHQNLQSYWRRNESAGLEAMHSLLGDVQRRASEVGPIFSRRMLTPVALGTVGTLALGAMMGDEGYAPRPMLMPGEYSDARINAHIAAGTALAGKERDRPAEDAMPMPAQSTIDRPINTGETYFANSSAWQISGQVPSTTGMRDLSAMISSLGGSSAVRVNDARRPITPNFIDRILGE